MIEAMSTNDARKRVALFGGTFDPIHEGHLEIAKKAVDQLKLDQVIFVPCRRSPHKEKEPGAPDGDRLEMLRLATAEIEWVEVTDYELKKPPPSYTWETVREFKKLGFELFLLIGFDQWEALPRWTHPERLAEDVEFIVVGRDEQPAPRAGYRSHFIHGDHPASSTMIRSSLRDGAPGKKPDWLANAVFRYIREKGLYRVSP